MYTQISLFLSAFSLHIAIASLIACSFAFVVIILSETLVTLLNLTSSCVNITVVSVSVLISAIFFRICDALIYITIFFVFLIDFAVTSRFFRYLCASASVLKAKIVDACLFLDRFSLLNNHIKLIISFNSRLKNSNSVFRFFISVFILKISIFRLCMTILCHFSSFLMLLTSKTCFHIALCASKIFAMYFFKILRTMLFFFCILTIMMIIRSIFAFFNALFIESRIFIVFNV